MTERILICTLGGTPQIVTETVWALMNDQERPWTPTRIEIITTTEKLRAICSALQNPAGQLAELFPAGTPPVVVYAPRRHDSRVLKPLELAWEGGGAAPPGTDTVDGRAMRDVADPVDSEIMGDLIKDRIWAAIVDRKRQRDTELHVSLAGGRKTMSAHALLALALLGRVQDEASHVLISPSSFENNEQFWHKRQPNRINTAAEIFASRRDGTPLPRAALDPADATITLIRVPTPFVAELPAGERSEMAGLSLSEILKHISLANRFRRAPELVFDDRTNTVQICGERAKVDPVAYAQLRFLAAARKERWPIPQGLQQGELSGRITWTSLTHGTDPSGTRVIVRLEQVVRKALEADGQEVGPVKMASGVTRDEPSTWAVVWKGCQATLLPSQATVVKFGSLPEGIREVWTWFKSLTVLRKQVARHFGHPLVNFLLPKPDQNAGPSDIDASSGKRLPSLRLACPPEAITFIE